MCAGFLLFILAVLVLSPSLALSQSIPDDASDDRHVAIAARIAGDDSRVRLVLDFEREPDFTLRYLENPDRVVVDLPETVFAYADDSVQPRGLVSAVRYGASGEGRARMVFALASPARIDLVESTEVARGAIHRLVFDAIAIDRAAFTAQVATSDWTNPAQETAKNSVADPVSDTLTIVIDAGHGGIDGGAEGPAGSMEKHITLAFAEAFKAALEAEDGIRVAMTRTDDRFLSLSARVRLAREQKADLLVSLHADSIRIKSLRGATVYTLSDKASDAVAQSLADQENTEDGIVGARLENAPEAIAAILVDLARTETRVFSTGLAQQVLNSFEGQVKLINNPLRHAGFRVLQAPDVPSILVEMGYLSNPEDEKLLTDEAWRESTARLLAQSVQNYRKTILAGRR
ncbi:MAG: N-acetylmuramoyl-L-alanine amidase [Hoeflea sp.]|nr:N-acetylmuramoyl-L-alanine amidase [Alphaproteobacteria bacterium]MBV1726105.1 N-acetylmuramoyl-L-alanine amidase [Hoeflea sp.]MBU4542374.1 N-acetylmuramoyl-L-alanine amidase [Alphaproteobacteria bacterium]MBU4550111.1 N-acetylmuramoyl-L-alanine amidase [Alphaproteobacteria bacterium]MBV1762715.1 N-acetylmuramoyl-L-alanine amidase [Hoeflea sp.]